MQYERLTRREAILNASYQKILDKQAEYEVELVDNEAFLEWTVSDWDETWQAKNDPDAERP